METVFYISNAVGSTLFFAVLKTSLHKNQNVIHSCTLSSAINEIKTNASESNKIIISDDFVNDLNQATIDEFPDFAFILQKLRTAIAKTGKPAKWCFLLDLSNYDGSRDEFVNFCKQANITLFDLSRDDIQKFINFVNT